MLNITGAYVVIGTKEPFAVMLSATAHKLYQDRVSVVGPDKAVTYTFGQYATHALPCTLDCMEFVALNYVGPHEALVRQICARVALGQPIGNGKDITEGGTPARIDAPVPRPGAPAGVAVEQAA